jgi:ABC-type transporter Mla maintaining outer membrane lipid asymmetry ATPase subunit MlaF
MRTAFGVADRMVMFDAGRVHMVGTPADFRSTSDVLVRDFVEGRVPADESAAPV